MRPGERVVTPYGLGSVLGPSGFGRNWMEVRMDGAQWPDHLHTMDLRPLYYPQQLAPGARKDNPSYAAAIADEVRGEANPYLEAQK